MMKMKIQMKRSMLTLMLIRMSLLMMNISVLMMLLMTMLMMMMMLMVMTISPPVRCLHLLSDIDRIFYKERAFFKNQGLSRRNMVVMVKSSSSSSSAPSLTITLIIISSVSAKTRDLVPWVRHCPDDVGGAGHDAGREGEMLRRRLVTPTLEWSGLGVAGGLF